MLQAEPPVVQTVKRQPGLEAAGISLVAEVAETFVVVAEVQHRTLIGRLVH